MEEDIVEVEELVIFDSGVLERFQGLVSDCSQIGDALDTVRTIGQGDLRHRLKR